VIVGRDTPNRSAIHVPNWRIAQMTTRMTRTIAIIIKTGGGNGLIQFCIAQIKPPMIASTTTRIKKLMSNPLRS
jgi:hypothetical protein